MDRNGQEQTKTDRNEQKKTETDRNEQNGQKQTNLAKVIQVKPSLAMFSQV